MIGGQVLDASAILAWCRQTSIMMQALVWSSVEDDIVLLVPASTLAEAARQLDQAQRAVLDVLVGLHVTVVDPLTSDQALTLDPGHRLDTAHALACARSRGWPVVTATPDIWPDDITLIPLP